MSEKIFKRIDEWVERHGIKSSELCILLDNLERTQKETEERLKEAEEVIMRLESHDFNESDRKEIAKKYWNKYGKYNK